MIDLVLSKGQVFVWNAKGKSLVVEHLIVRIVYYWNFLLFRLVDSQKRVQNCR